MNGPACFFVAALFLSFLGPPARAQPKDKPMEDSPAMGQEAKPGSTQEGMQGQRDGGCSPICQMMMEKEMKAMPLKIAFGSVFGLLLLAALTLLVVLEIQWVRLWSIRLKKEKP